MLNDISVSGITPLNFINKFVEYLLNKIITGDKIDSNKVKFINDYIGIHRPKDFPVKMTNILSKYFPVHPDMALLYFCCLQ